jgi:DNA-binding PadR family transcriptional regulator
MHIPRLSHIQFLTLIFLSKGALTGRELRDALAAHGVRRSGPGFYQIMARLEDAGFVTGRYQQEIVDGQIIRERSYKVTAVGRRACAESRAFYLEWIGRLDSSGAHA